MREHRFAKGALVVKAGKIYRIIDLWTRRSRHGWPTYVAVERMGRTVVRLTEAGMVSHVERKTTT